MTEINDGGPAFPVPETLIADENHCLAAAYQGMSLRDWFAGMALQGQISSTPEVQDYPNPDSAAVMAYKYADAMLKARGQ